MQRKSVKTCPSNVFFEDTLCIKANQHTDVGSVNIEARKKEGEAGYELFRDIDITAPVVSSGDVIKMWWDTSAGGSAPGRYNIKEGASYTDECFDLTGLCDTQSWYDAIHIDMTDGNTDWALDCEDTDESLVSSRFQGKKGFQGFGKHFNFAPCCPTSVTCGGGTCSGGGSVDGGGGGGVGGGETFNCNWSCEDGGSTVGTRTGLTTVPEFCV